MGVAATGSTEMAFQIAKATAQALGSVGVNWIMGPVLDVLTNVKNQPLGVRTTGDDAEEVSRYGVAFMKGYKDAGIATCGKHFPSYGNLEFLGSSLDVPIITDSLEQLSLSALVPFRNAVSQGVDAMMVGGCAMSSAGIEVMHACLSQQVVDELLRDDIGFDGVVVSECLEMEALSHNIGVGGGTVMATNAGCDLILVCRSFAGQQEAITGMKVGVENGVITKSRIQNSLRRVLEMKAKCTSWEKALSPGGNSTPIYYLNTCKPTAKCVHSCEGVYTPACSPIVLLWPADLPIGTNTLSSLQPSHAKLSTKAYESSITVVRDKARLLPLSNILEPEEELLILSPLVKPLPASAASRDIMARHSVKSPTEYAQWEKSIASPPSNASGAALGMVGESIFKEFGRSIARQRNGRVLHTSYTANGVRPVHENLINRASAVIVLTADANRNLYQHGFTKHVAMICKSLFAQGVEKREKPFVVISVSSPYDFALDSSVGTYICTYDFTETALQALVNVLFGDLSPTGALPGTINQSQKVHQSKQHWLVENWNEQRDAEALDTLLQSLQQETPVSQRSELAGCSSSTFLIHHDSVDEAHFVVRNSSTRALYGFCSTYYFRSTGTGVIGAILVAPGRRKLSIGNSLHNRAIKALQQRGGIKRLQLGSRLPSVFLGIPSSSNLERKRLRRWFADMGWNTALSRPVCSMMMLNLSPWSPPADVARSLQHQDMQFDIVQGSEYAASLNDHVRTTSRQGMLEVYQLALADPSEGGIIRATRSNDEAVLGTVVVCTSKAKWADRMPALKASPQVTGGISSPIVSPSVGEYSTLLQGLILFGIQWVKNQQAEAVVLDHVRLPLRPES